MEIENIKVLLGDSAGNYTDEQISIQLGFAKAEVEAYCNRPMDNDAVLEVCVARICVIKLNRINTEGLTGQSYSGVSENYIDGYPADIVAVLNSKRKLKVV